MGDTIVVRIVEAIARFKSVDPTELEYAVGEYIDMEAIQALATTGTSAWTLSFELPDCTVIVTSDDDISIIPGSQPVSQAGLN